jgi:fructokinase
MNTFTHYPVVCFGEVLWDILPAGNKPGGAPVNVAYHLQKLGQPAALITRVGNDAEGHELKNIFSAYGVCTEFFQIDDHHATGKVFGRLNDHNEMIYDIEQPSAWDYIEWQNNLHDLVTQCRYFVFGSLACRNNTSKQTLFSLLEAASQRVLDINLRTPFYNKQLVTELLQRCDILKLNISELQLMAGWFNSFNTMEGKLMAIQEKFGIDTIILTMGAEGALLSLNGVIQQQPGHTVEVADTVGAGDAFLAGFLTGMLNNRTTIETMHQAAVMGAFVASKNGACPQYNLSDISAY